MVPFEKGEVPMEVARAAIPKMFRYKPVVIEDKPDARAIAPFPQATEDPT